MGFPHSVVVLARRMNDGEVHMGIARVLTVFSEFRVTLGPFRSSSFLSGFLLVALLWTDVEK